MSVTKRNHDELKLSILQMMEHAGIREKYGKAASDFASKNHDARNIRIWFHEKLRNCVLNTQPK